MAATATKRIPFGSDEWYEANKHLCHEWDTDKPDGGIYVYCLHCGDRATLSNGRNYCPERRKTDPFTGQPAATREEHYAGLTDQIVKNLGMGTVDALLADGKPETAAIVRELVRRMRG
jgi:hypothetical protein